MNLKLLFWSQYSRSILWQKKPLKQGYSTFRIRCNHSVYSFVDVKAYITVTKIIDSLQQIVLVKGHFRVQIYVYNSIFC